jgi:hypothetical protein
MPAIMSIRRNFWRCWLLSVAIGTAVFGLVLVALPHPTSAGFNLMIYGQAESPPDFSAEAVHYSQLVHAVLGAVMVGWGVLMAMILAGPARRDFHRGWKSESWRMIAISLSAWAIPDTLYSLASGYWPNAILNSIFITLFAAPLMASVRDEG